MNLKTFCVGLLVASVSLATACEKKSAEGAKGGATQTSNAAGRCPHDIKQEKCPFCNPGLIESDGFCGEHGVAEALCVQCRPYLKTAFRAKGDWCKEHEMADSQCVKCHPELKEKIRPGEHGPKTPPQEAKGSDAAQCEHTITKAKCPFCTPSLVKTDGFCKEHDVAEALCVECRPYLKAAFEAKGDWCKEHNTPESQCIACNPELKDKPKGKG